MKISDHVELIDGTMANAYVINFNQKIFLIDSGTRGSGKVIVNYFQKRNMKPDIVLITHYHPDHVGGLASIDQEFSPEIYAPDVEMNVLLGRDRIKPAKSLLSKFVAGISRIQPVNRVIPISNFKSDDIKVLETPGHTPQSTSYIFEPDKIIFVGDALFVNREGKFLVNRSFTLDHARAEGSKERIISFKGYTVAPGHGHIKKID